MGRGIDYKRGMGKGGIREAAIEENRTEEKVSMLQYRVCMYVDP